MAHSILLLAILAVTFNFSTARLDNNVDWCRIPCQWNGMRHTLCLYQSQQPSYTCGEVVRNSLTQSEKQRIVDYHNQLRYKVYSGQESRGNPGPQPSSRRMSYLEWDEDLAFIAQRWANQCIYKHDCGNLVDYNVGQNIGFNEPGDQSEEVTVESFIQGWYDEVAEFSKYNVSPYRSISYTLHYTQLVWANTTKVGCGIIKYKARGKSNYKTQFVCNYGPQGNIPGQSIY